MAFIERTIVAPGGYIFAEIDEPVKSTSFAHALVDGKKFDACSPLFRESGKGVRDLNTIAIKATAIEDAQTFFTGKEVVVY